jgi:hypothetical protein
MKKETITYVDYNGEERTEEYLFNLSMAEITEIQLGIEGGMAEKLKKIEKDRDVPEAMKFFKDLIFKSYGEKSLDGKRFIKSEELSTAFSQSEAYSTLFMKLISDPDAAAAFVNGIVPADLAKKVAELESGK